MISRSGWCSLQLASACIARDADRLEYLAAAITAEFDVKDIKEIWQKTKMTLQLAEVRWLKEQLAILSNKAIAA